MKTRFFLALSAIIFLLAPKAHAQSSDRIKYYIVYDVSGSVPLLDPNGNLKKLLDQFIRISQQKTAAGNTQKLINSYADFNIYFIGGSKTDVVGSNAYLSVQVTNPRASSQILNAIDEQIKSSHNQKFTYMHTALDKIIEATNADKESGGVFIYTDGVINNTDFEQNTADPKFSDRDHYIAYINQLIGKLQNIQKKPVYIIQSSLLPQNYFSIIPDQVKYPINTADIFKNDHWFWIKNSNVITDTSKTIKASFEKFMDKANMDIVLSGSDPIKAKDSIGVVIKTQEILNLTNALASDHKEELISLALNKNISPGLAIGTSIQKIRTLLKADTLNQAQLIALKSGLKILEDQPQQLLDIEKSIQDTINNQATTTIPFLENERLTQAYNPTLTTDIQAVKSAKNAESFQQMAIEAVADYLIDRTKSEAIYAFMDNINDKVLNRAYQYREIGRFLLPNLKIVLNDAQNFSDLNIIKNALRKDIQQLPDNMIAHSDLFVKSEGLEALKYYYQLYKSINQTNSLEIAFSELAKYIEKNGLDDVYRTNSSTVSRSQIQQSILFTARLITYLKDHDLSKIYQDQEKLTEISKLLVALSLDNTHITRIDDLPKIAEIIKDIYNNYQILKSQIAAYQVILKQNPTTDYDGYKKYKADAIADILKQVAHLMLSGAPILQQIKFDDESIVQSLEKIENKVDQVHQIITQSINNTPCKFEFTRASNSVSLILTIDSKVQPAISIKSGYSSITIGNQSYGIHILNYDKIRDMGTALNFIIEPAIDQESSLYSKTSIVQQANNCIEGYFLIREEKYQEAISLLVPDIVLSIKSRFAIDTTVLNLVTQTIQIGGEVSSAKSSEEIKNIISRYALPVASYKIKRATNQTLMLNAYTGLAPYSSVYTSDWSAHPAIIAPIGFEFSFPIFPRAQYHKSLGIMLNVVDIGNIIDYRLLAKNDDDTNEVVNFERILAPGLFITYGTSNKIPLSLIAGYEMNPGRFTFGVAFDLPLLSFWKGNLKRN